MHCVFVQSIHHSRLKHLWSSGNAKLTCTTDETDLFVFPVSVALKVGGDDSWTCSAFCSWTFACMPPWDLLHEFTLCIFLQVSVSWWCEMLSHEDLAAEMIVLGLFLRITRLRWKFVFIAFIGFHEQPLELLKKTNKQEQRLLKSLQWMVGLIFFVIIIICSVGWLLHFVLKLNHRKQHSLVKVFSHVSTIWEKWWCFHASDEWPSSDG